MIKRYYSIVSMLFIGLLCLSCTRTLEEINVNPNSPTNVSPGPLFTGIQLRSSGENVARRSNIGYCMMMVQQTATLKTNDLEGDKYLPSGNASILFSDSYGDILTNMAALMPMLQNDPEKINLLSATRIWRVLVYHRITDLYGDIPYSEAGKGFTEQIYRAKYDTQESIYKDMLKELEEAAAAFDPSKVTYESADLVYQGNVGQWKKLAYSLMLRLGMRLTKVDPALAEQWVRKAVEGGVMQSNDDICFIAHSEDRPVQSNPISYAFEKFNLVELGDIKISKKMMSHLKTTQDPRLAVYASLPSGDNSLASQKGLPNGFDASTITAYPGGGDLSTYSTFNVNALLKLNAPSFLLTYAEVELMLAEATARGWVAGDASTHYFKGVKASMQQQSRYGAAITDVQIATYKTANPYPVGGNLEQQLEAVNTQYWVATFLNGFESYANWRRTGYPELDPVSYPGNASGGTIPRRMVYPRSEYSGNPDNLQAAVDRQGPDEFTTRVWWDK